MWWWLSCVPMTAYGLRTDGLLPPTGRVEVTASGGAGSIADSRSGAAGGALGGMVGITDRVAIGFEAGGGGPLDEAPSAGAGLDVRARALREEDGALNLTFLLGGSVVARGGGVHAGVVASAPLGRIVRPYVGFVWDRPLREGGLWYGTVAAGARLRAPIAEHAGLFAGAELAWSGDAGGDWSGVAGYASFGVRFDEAAREP